MKPVVSVIGAGGKMGVRCSRNLLQSEELFQLNLVDQGERGLANIRSLGAEPADAKTAVPQSDLVVLAVPDKLIQTVSETIVVLLKPGAGLIILDPAAAVARELALRDDCTFAVVHPCHPSYFLDQDTYEARHDYFGGAGGKQDLVMAKIQGDDQVFASCQTVCRAMFAPVAQIFTMGIRDIAFLEPTLVELLGATCLFAMAETVGQAVARGIDKQAAISFLTGHIYNLTANFLGLLGDTPVSDACKVAIGLGNKLVLREDWKQIWNDAVLDRVIATMLHPDQPQI
ncbi:MAG: phosphogluconate dehydrogenase C-terminal domain-containing protein [Eubacteriales bacterium]|nr:F420-dependent NADP oxidoreductase [Clostridiales bacterium]MDD4140832.1 phosphogluconate dehydrogenase C-terminal domain-containing protein [Eubacteriales bacterium]